MSDNSAKLITKSVFSVGSIQNLKVFVNTSPNIRVSDPNIRVTDPNIMDVTCNSNIRVIFSWQNLLT